MIKEQKHQIVRLSIAIFLIFIYLSGAISPPPVYGWSRKGHILITRMAVASILDDAQAPQELKRLLLSGIDNADRWKRISAYAIASELPRSLDQGFDYYAFRPDEYAGLKTPITQFNSTEDVMHYLNLENFNPNPAQRSFQIDGGSRISAQDLPRNEKDPRYAEAGYVTFRAEQCYNKMVSAFANNVTDEEAIIWISYLSHYIGDAYQPYHASEDYRGFNCSCNKDREEKYNFHKEMEGTLFELPGSFGKKMRGQYWQYFEHAFSQYLKEATPQNIDPYLATQEALLSGYNYLPFLCNAADRSLTGQEFRAYQWFNYHEKIGDREISLLQLKAERMARAAYIIRSLILQGWQSAQAKKR